MPPKRNNAEWLFFRILGEDNRDIIKGELRRLSDAEWKQMLNLAIKTALVPAFYKRLFSFYLDITPQSLVASLKNIHLLNLKRNLILEQELFRAISFFKENNITAIPLKGPVLAQCLYGDIALRSASADLDLLVKEEDFLRAKELLVGLGYNLVSHNNSESCYNFYLKYLRQLPFRKNNGKEGNLFLELHYDLRGEFVYAPLNDFWQGLNEFDIGKIKVLIPTKENLLLYLCLLILPVYEITEVRYIYDLHSLVSRYGKEICWDQLGRKIQGSQHESCVYFALKLSKELFQTDIPANFLKELKPGIIKSIILSLWVNNNNVLYTKRDCSLRWYYFFTGWYYFASSLLYSSSLLDAISIIYRKIFLPKVEMVNLYNPESTSKLLPLLYLRRLIKPLTRIFNH